MAYRRISTQTLFGALVVALGALLLASTTGLYDTGPIVRYVPSLFVLLGLYALVASGFRNVGGPLFIVAIAGTWQLVALDAITVERALSFWPLLIVIFGVSLLLGRYRSVGRVSDNSRIDLVSIFGGRTERITSRVFTGGDATVVFGSGEVDLRDAAVPTPPARINATALFGEVELTVPREWNVHFDVIPVLGAAEDERPRQPEVHEEVDLVVDGFCMFGAVTVRD